MLAVGDKGKNEIRLRVRAGLVGGGADRSGDPAARAGAEAASRVSCSSWLASCPASCGAAFVSGAGCDCGAGFVRDAAFGWDATFVRVAAGMPAGDCKFKAPVRTCLAMTQGVQQQLSHCHSLHVADVDVGGSCNGPFMTRSACMIPHQQPPVLVRDQAAANTLWCGS